MRKGHWTPASLMRERLWLDALGIIATALLYFLAARLSLLFLFEPVGIAAVWPPTGIFLSAVLLTRRGARPYLIGALFLADLAAEMLAGTPFVVSLVYAVTPAANVMLSAWLLLRFVGEPLTFRRVREVIGFLLLSVLLSNALTSILSASAAKLYLGAPFWPSWFRWWSSDGVGTLLVTPLIMSWAYSIKTIFKEFKSQAIEYGVLVLAMVFLGNYAFSHFTGEPWLTLLLNLFTFSFLILASLRFGMIGAVTTSLILAGLILWNTIRQHFTFFGAETTLTTAILVQIYVAMASIPSMLLAALFTERKQVEEALRESEERLKRAQEIAHLGSWEMNLVQNRLTWSDEVYQIFGLQPQEFGATYEAFLEYVHPDDRAAVDAAYSGSLRENRDTYEIEHRVVRKSTGEIRIVHEKCEHLRDPGGKIIRSIGMVHDITERKRAEQVQSAIYRISEAAQAAQKLDEFFGAIHAIIGELMPAKNFYIALYDASTDLFVTPYLVDEFGAPPPPYTPGKGLTAYVLRTGKPLLATPEVFEQLVQSGQVELIGRPSVDWLGVPLHTPQGTLGVMAVHTYTEAVRLGEADKDVLVFVSTQVAMAIERKRAEEALRESEHRFRTLAEASFEGIAVTEKGVIVDLNDQLANMFGYARSELVGKPVMEVVAPESRSLVAEAIRSGRLEPYEHLALRKDGATFPVEVHARTTQIAGRQLRVTAIRDITERKRAEEQLRASLAEKEVLLKEIHHRVKNNIQVIVSLLGLQAGHIRDQQALEMFKESQERVRAMAFIHEKLYQSQDLAQVGFAEYVQKLTLHLFRLFGVDPDVITLQVDVADVVLGIDAAVPCGLIINELVSNCLKHAFPGGRKGTVRVEMHPKDGKVVLVVGDNGVGFPASLDFWRTESLGLQLVTILTNQLRGEIELDRNDGTTFKITFERAFSETSVI